MDAAHVDDLDLAMFVSGGGTAGDRERIAEHLDSCEVCREVSRSVRRSAATSR